MLAEDSERIPLVEDQKGVLRVAGTRVPLDALIDLFDEGASPEEIVEQFDALQLADVYTVIGYYLRHRNAVHAHLAKEDRSAKEERQRIEARFSNRPLVERLRRTKEARKAPGGHQIC